MPFQFVKTKKRKNNLFECSDPALDMISYYYEKAAAGFPDMVLPHPGWFLDWISETTNEEDWFNSLTSSDFFESLDFGKFIDWYIAQNN